MQKEAPVDLLLSKDVLSQLGFALTEAKQNHSTNVLRIGSVERSYSGDPDPSERAEENGETTPCHTGAVNSTTDGAVVKLIRAIRLPAGHSQLVRAAVDSAVVQWETCLFPSCEQINESELGQVRYTNGPLGPNLLLKNKYIWEESS